MQDPNYNPIDEGKATWSGLSHQLTELRSFTSAMIAELFGFIGKNILWLILLPLVCGAAVYFFNRTQETRYKATMTVSYVHLEKKIYADMLVKLNDAIAADKVLSMPGCSRLSEEAVASLLGVSSRNIEDEALTEDLSVEKIPFNIIVTVNELAQLEEIEEAIVRYLNSPPFVQDRLEYNLQKSTADIAFYEKAIAGMQSLLNNEGANMDAEKYKAIYTGLVAAHDALTDARAQGYFNKNIEVLHGFEESSAQMLTYPWKNVTMGATVGLLLACLLAFMRRKA